MNKKNKAILVVAVLWLTVFFAGFGYYLVLNLRTTP